MFFENGLLAEWNKDIRYNMNEVDVSVPLLPAPTDKIESLGSRHMKNFLIPMKKKASTLLQRNWFMFSRITVGIPFTFDLDSTIEIIAPIDVDIPSTIEVLPSLPAKPKNEFNEDILDCTITPAVISKLDITSLIFVEDVPEGTVVNLSKYTEIYDIYSRVEIGGTIDFDFNCTVEVDGSYD